MKKVFHIINGIISVLLLITGIRMLILAKPELLMSYICLLYTSVPIAELDAYFAEKFAF